MVLTPHASAVGDELPLDDRFGRCVSTGMDQIGSTHPSISASDWPIMSLFPQSRRSGGAARDLLDLLRHHVRVLRAATGASGGGVAAVAASGVAAVAASGRRANGADGDGRGEAGHSHRTGRACYFLVNCCECTIDSLLVVLHCDCTLREMNVFALFYLASSFRSRSMTEGSNLMKIVVRYGRLGCGVECAVTRAGWRSVCGQVRRATRLSHYHA